MAISRRRNSIRTQEAGSFPLFIAGTCSRMTADQYPPKSSNTAGEKLKEHRSAPSSSYSPPSLLNPAFSSSFPEYIPVSIDLCSLLSVTHFELSSDYSASGVGLPGRSPELVRPTRPSRETREGHPRNTSWCPGLPTLPSSPFAPLYQNLLLWLCLN